jgi:tetratricopeptide (TPR) repeat protein
LVALEVLVRAAGVRTADDPYLQFGRVASFFTDVEIGGKPHKRVIARDLYREREVTFAVNKAAGTFRIFCIGSSASAGWPHPANETYSAYLTTALAKAYPDRAVEVINVSAHAYAAYRQRLILNEVLEHQPDLIIIYSGNNEFIERRHYAVETSWRDSLAAAAEKSRLYKVLRGTLPARVLFRDNTFDAQKRSNVAFEQWSKIEQLPLTLRTDPAQLQKVVQHFEFSIGSMVEAAKARGVPVVLLTVPTNLRHWQPNVSVASVRGEREVEWRGLYQAGRAALLKGDATRATEALTQAAALDPGHAATHYHLAQALEAGGRFAEAYASYDRARDLDANPFRAISSFNDIIRRIAQRSDNVRLVDAERLFQTASQPHTPGFDLFLDYVHPSVKGNMVLARGVFDAIVGARFIAPAASSSFPQIATYDESKDQSLQRTLIILAMMMHQNEMIVRKVDLIASNPGGLASLGEKEARQVAAVRDVFRDVVALEHRELMTGEVPKAEREKLTVRLNQVYRDVFANYQDFQRQAAR